MILANYLEEIYQRYRSLRDVARSVYPDKIEEYEQGENPLSFEKICGIVAFSFDSNNQKKVAELLNHQRPDSMLLELCLLSTGARLEKQGK